MLLIIHNLPGDISFDDIKELIREKCGLTEIILDDLRHEGKGKRVTVGLADEEDGTLLIKRLSGFFCNGFQLFVEDMRKKKQSEAPKNIPEQENWRQQPNQSKQNYEKSDVFQREMVPPPVAPVQTYNNLPFYMTPNQSSHVSYDKAPANLQPQVPFYAQGVGNSMYRQPDTANPWNQKMTTYPDKSTPPNQSDNRYPQRGQNQPAGKDNRNFPKDRESKWRNEDGFEPQMANKDFRNRGNERYDRKNYRSPAFDDYEDRGRYDEQSPPRNYDRFDNRSMNRGDVRDNNDYKSSSRSSRFDRSPPRSRSPQRPAAPRRGRDRYRGPQRGFSSGYDDSEPQRNFDCQGPRDFGDYDQRVDFDETQRKNDRQNSFGPKRPYPNFSKKPSKTYGNDPNNSTFTKSNENIFNAQVPMKSFDAQSRKRVLNPSGPPAKSAKFNKVGGNVAMPGGSKSGASFAAPTGNPPKNAPGQTGKTKLAKHNAWREHVAGILAGKVIKNSNPMPGRIPHYKVVVQNLRKCIASRIDVILGDHIVDSLNEMMESYRSKFSVEDDPGFYQAVVEKLEREKQESTQRAPEPKCNKPSSGPNQMNINQNQNVPPQTAGRLPKYPEANKQVYKDQKKVQKLEYEETMYALDPTLKKALDEEMDDICKAFVAGCPESTDKDEETMRQKLLKNTVPTFKKILSVHITKRLLNIKTNLVVRIFAIPKPPKRDELDAFLKSVGAVSLKKSDMKKMFMATCDSYESYDKLLDMKCAMIGDIELRFKPLHLIGPPEKRNKKQNKKNNNQAEINEIKESSDEEIDEFGADVQYIDDDLTKPKTDVKEDQLNISQDVILVDDDKEVLLVEDSDHNETSDEKPAQNNENKDLIEAKPDTEEVKAKNDNDESKVINDDDVKNDFAIAEDKNIQEMIPTPCDRKVFVDNVLNTTDGIDFAEDDLEDF